MYSQRDSAGIKSIVSLVWNREAAERFGDDDGGQVLNVKPAVTACRYKQMQMCILTLVKHVSLLQQSFCFFCKVSNVFHVAAMLLLQAVVHKVVIK